MFNLSQTVLSEIEIQVLEKELDFVPTQKFINEPGLRKDFEDFSRRMRIRCNFRDRVLKVFLINQCLTQNVTGNLLLVIMAWNYF